VELWTHGSPAVLAELVEAALGAGAVAAGPGEFTYRALCRGRLDLTRAEAVHDLVAARTAYQARVAFAQAEGALSRRLAPLREGLDEWIARTEAAIDFADESETHLSRAELAAALDHLRAGLRGLLSGYVAGRVVREGATVAIVGRPNVGKSSIFNRLLDRERAIVTPIAGTTRDTVEEDVSLDGVPIRLVDTAGLRAASHPVEREGVARAERARDLADLVVLVLDGSRTLEPGELTAEHIASSRSRTVIAINKCDLPGAALSELAGVGAVRVCALSGDGVSGLRRELRERLGAGALLEDPVLTNARHASAIEQAVAALDRAARARDAGHPDELVAEDLRQARAALGSITGEMGYEELYARIFSTFCIGK
jgi:tRNA modification GTPase